MRPTSPKHANMNSATIILSPPQLTHLFLPSLFLPSFFYLSFFYLSFFYLFLPFSPVFWV